MTLKLINIENAGDLNNERVVLQADIDTNIGRYVLLRARTAPDRQTTKCTVGQYHRLFGSIPSQSKRRLSLCYIPRVAYGARKQEITALNLISFIGHSRHLHGLLSSNPC